MASCSTRWIAPAFDDDRALRRGSGSPPACSPTSAGRAHPDFRAERGIDMALHGNWVAIDAPGPGDARPGPVLQFRRRPGFPYPAIAALCTPGELERAAGWGYAMRLGQRLSGGVAAGLAQQPAEPHRGGLCCSRSMAIMPL